MTLRSKLVDPTSESCPLTTPEQKIVFPPRNPPYRVTSLITDFPLQPNYCSDCNVNQKYHVLPRVQFDTAKDSVFGYPISKEVSGPRQIAKQLYWEKTPERRYPYIYQYKPVDTLYGNDFSDFF